MNPDVLMLDETFVPRARDDVTAAVLDGETVIHCDGALHHLSRIATLVWQCSDGEVTVEGLADELAGAFGADTATVERDVSVAVLDLAARGLLVLPNDPGFESEPEPFPDVLAEAPGSCASCDRGPGWSRRATLRVGASLVDVGSDDAALDGALRAAFAAHLGSEVDAARTRELLPYYGVALAAELPASGPRPLHRLHRGTTVPVRSRDPERVLRALATHLATHADLAASGLAPLPGLVIGGPAGAVIVPRPGRPVAYERELVARGLRVADAPVALVDVETREVVVGAPGLTVDLAPLEAQGSARPGSPDPAALTWGRYPLLAFVLDAPAGPGAALLTFGPRVADPYGVDAVLDALVALVELVPVHANADAAVLADLLGAR